jgi:hypothetical protein
MKNILSTVITAAAVFIISGCEQFSTSYQRIDDTEFRLLKILWSPTDAAPGDTVTVTAVFAGKRLDLRSDLEWFIHFNMIRSLTGSETVVDTARLDTVALSCYDTAFSPNTQAVAFKIPIPKGIVRNSASIPERWTDMLPPELRGAIPPQLSNVTKSQMVNLLESPEDMGNMIKLISSGDSARAQVLLAQTLQFFTVPIRISAKLHEPGRLPHTMISNHTIRYNNRFEKYGAPINYAPTALDVLIYKAKGDVNNIDNKAGLQLDSIVIDNSGNSVIEVEKGYSYFLDVHTWHNDSTITMFGNKIYETLDIYRQFQLDKEETAGVHHSKFMDIANYNGKVTFPTDKRITKFVFWMTMTDTDNMTNERLRPVGATLVEVSGRFVYK